MRLSKLIAGCSLLLACAVPVTAHADVLRDGASALAQDSDLQSLVQWKVAHVNAENPRVINPCWLVDLTFWNTADHDDYVFIVSVSYTSNGHTIERAQVWSMSDTVPETPKRAADGSAGFDETQWIQVTTDGFDIGNHLHDDGTPITGTVYLAHVHHDGDGDHDHDGHGHDGHDHDGHDHDHGGGHDGGDHDGHHHDHDCIANDDKAREV